MYPFHWVPAGGARHASLDAHPGGAFCYPSGTSVRTLCEQQLTADNSVLAWLWDTCGTCNDEARRLACTVAR
ncbi:zinc finger protein [Saccharopolyspora sp. 5N708]|uniref:zinc finger protein n=1 Tax=Saccharopolyspora sp. 5N708 TaxID=3457424 RepID=UPI003FD37414